MAAYRRSQKVCWLTTQITIKNLCASLIRRSAQQHAQLTTCRSHVSLPNKFKEKIFYVNNCWGNISRVWEDTFAPAIVTRQTTYSSFGQKGMVDKNSGSPLPQKCVCKSRGQTGPPCWFGGSRLLQGPGGFYTK